MSDPLSTIGRGTGLLYDAVVIEKDMPVWRLIALLSKGLEISEGSATIVGIDDGKLCIVLKSGPLTQGGPVGLHARRGSRS